MWRGEGGGEGTHKTMLFMELYFPVYTETVKATFQHEVQCQLAGPARERF